MVWSYARDPNNSLFFFFTRSGRSITKTHLFQYWNRNDKNLENEFHKLKAYYIYISNGLSNI